MADLPVLPIPPATLSRLVAEAWGDRDGLPGVARTSGVDPAMVGAFAGPHGDLTWRGLTKRPRSEWVHPTVAARALYALADVLEGQHYLVVDRTAGLRVMGWAAETRGGPRWVEGVRLTHPRLVPLADLDATDPRRIAWDDRCLKERAARLPPMPAERAEKLRRFGR